MKILLTGASGQFGRRFLELCPHDVVPTYHSSGGAGEERLVLELEDSAACDRVVREARPDWVVHAAAMTNVDQCEREPAAAEAANALGTGNLAKAAAAVGARFAYISTDYVFDGTKGNYREDDPVNPINVYGATKLAGERLAQAAVPGALIARTSVVYGPHKKNFVTWLVGELDAGRPVRIVDDQFVNPTLTYDLVRQVLALIEAGAEGVFHTTGATALSRLEMARETARAFGLDEALITPIKSSDLTWVARRPLNSTMDVSKVSKYCAPLPYSAALRQLQSELAAGAAGTASGAP